MDFLDGMLGGGLNSSSTAAAAAGNANHSNGGNNNNSSSNNNNNNGGGRGKMCRSASEMDMEQTSRDQDWRGSAGSASSLKMARTDSYPNLMRTNSVISEANTAANGANSSDLLEESRLLRSDSSAASVYSRGCLPVFQQQQQQHQTGSYHQYAANNNRPSGMPLLMGASSVGGAGMGMGVGMHSILSCARSPFTAAQWQELEHQALIFKYILAGVQVPSEILIPIRSKIAAAAAASPINLFSTLPVSAGSSLRPNLGWNSYHLGFANNADPEPGRCRRTDGKKWRCSRDAVPDQKYCERHMNRGRHRSRKPVEGQTNSAANATSATTATSSATAAAAAPTAATSSSNNSLAMSQASSSASNLGAAASNPAGLAAVAAAAARTAGLSMVSTHNNNSTAPQSQATNNNNALRACALGPQQNPQIGGTTAAALSKFVSFPSSMASSAASAPQFPNLDSYVSGLKAGAGAGTGAADMETSHIFESSTGLSMMNSSNTAAWRSRLTAAAAAASATYNNSHDTSFLQHHHHHRGDDAADAPGIRHFFDDWPSRSSRDRAVQWPGVAGTQLSISMGSAGGGSPPEKLTLSPLKLSIAGKDDPLEMELGLANDTADEQRQRVAANWIPIPWEIPVGGPLAEVLNNTAATGNSREVKSSLNLMTNGWDCSGSPRGDESRMASPTGVLQKTLGSLSDSSTGSSPRSVVVKTDAADAAAAAAGPLCENVRTASFKLAGATAPISTS